MPITVPCPHCHKKWKLKDEYAGKRIKCPNPECAQVIAIPAAPAANGELTAKPAARPVAKAAAEPASHPPDAESIAAAMFNEEAPKPQVEDTRTFDYTCIYCDHKWTLPIAQQGKNVLCPECKQRQKIPEKKEVKADWRDPNAQRPSMARGPELPEDLKDQQTKNVTIDSLQQAGAIPEPEIEPRPLGTKLKFAAGVLAVLAGIALAVVYVVRSRSEGSDLKIYAAGVTTIQEVKADGGLAKGQPGLFRGALYTAAGEAALRFNVQAKTKEALAHFGKARQELEESPKSFERDYLLGELAVAVLALGGTPEQVANELRFRWLPDVQIGNQPRFQGNGNDVQAELRRVLLALKAEGKTADLDFRLSVVRRVARALIAKGQLETLTEILAQGFNGPEMLEAKAHVSLERIRAGAAPDKPALRGEEFVPTLEQRYAAAAGPDALATAKKIPSPEARLQALALIAEFSNEGKAAVATAVETIEKDKTGTGMPPTLLIRLGYWAGKAGERSIAELISDPNVQALASAEGLRGRIAANPTLKPDVASLAKTGTGQAVVGQLCETLIGCRQNAHLNQDKKAAKDCENWNAGTFRSAGLLGFVLGVQDAQGK